MTKSYRMYIEFICYTRITHIDIDKAEIDQRTGCHGALALPIVHLQRLDGLIHIVLPQIDECLVQL